eukprot:8957026-Alexandrium_andersonii.AAC.1
MVMPPSFFADADHPHVRRHSTPRNPLPIDVPEESHQCFMKCTCARWLLEFVFRRRQRPLAGRLWFRGRWRWRMGPSQPEACCGSGGLASSAGAIAPEATAATRSN